MPSVIGFVRVAPALWGEKEMPAADRERVSDAVAEARHSIEQFFASESGSPVVLACATPRCFRRWGGIGQATTFLADRVLLSPDVGSVKLSHEVSHVELASRIGVVRVLLNVPRWFDEGLAVLVSEDPEFGEARWLAGTNGGATLRGWLSVRKELSYGTARHEVARWYARAGPRGLGRMLAALRAGETFERACSSAEETRR